MGLISMEVGIIIIFMGFGCLIINSFYKLKWIFEIILNIITSTLIITGYYVWLGSILG
jgi:hypothetical protein